MSMLLTSRWKMRREGEEELVEHRLEGGLGGVEPEFDSFMILSKMLFQSRIYHLVFHFRVHLS